jgi:hypothetical protein
MQIKEKRFRIFDKQGNNENEKDRNLGLLMERKHIR